MPLALGRILHEHGVKGNVKFFLYNPESKLLKKGVTGYLHKGDVKKKVLLEEVKINPKIILVKFDFINSPEMAKDWRQAEFWVEPASYEALGEGEYYLNDLVGYRVLESGQGEVGKFLGYQEQKGARWFVLEDSQGREQLIPWTADTFRSVDREKKTIELLLPEGLSDLWKPTS